MDVFDGTRGLGTMTERDERHLAGGTARDVGFDALVRSDPAGASVPDPTRLWPLVLARTQDDAAGAYGSSSRDSAVHDAAVRHSAVHDAAADAAAGPAAAGPATGDAQVVPIGTARRRRSGLLRAAAAAAAAVVVASGGYAVGANRAAPGDRVTVPSGPVSYGAEVAGPSEEDSAVAERLRFVADDLAAGPERASVWVLDPSVDPSVDATAADEPAGADDDALDEELFEEEGNLSRGILVGKLPLVSVDEAVERLGDPVYQVSYLPGAPLTLPAPELSDDEPGERVPWSVVEVRITSAVVASEVVPAADGRDWVVPVYEFSDGRDNVWRVLALEDGALDTAPR